MKRAPVVALAAAKATDTYDPGMCLKFVRTRYGVDRKFADATEAFQHTDRRHDSWPPPAGAPVWWTGGHGHVAISRGGGYVITTDNPLEGRGEVGQCAIAVITDRWGKTYQGWSEDLNDQLVYDWVTLDLSEAVKAARLDPKGPQGTRTYPWGVRKIEAALYVMGYLPRAYAFDGSYGTETLNAYSRFQWSLGYAGSPEEPGSAADGVPGAVSLARLGRRYHWMVTA